MKLYCRIKVPMDVYIQVERDQLPKSKIALLRNITFDEKNAGTIGIGSRRQPDIANYYERTDAIRHTWDHDSTADDVEVLDENFEPIDFDQP